MKFESLYDLYISELKDLYSAEDQIIQALPKVIEKTDSAELRHALESHLEETRTHVTRLERVFEMHGVEAKKQKCKGMQGNSSLPRLLGRQERWSRFSSSVAANGLGEVVQSATLLPKAGLRNGQQSRYRDFSARAAIAKHHLPPLHGDA